MTTTPSPPTCMRCWSAWTHADQVNTALLDFLRT